MAEKTLTAVIQEAKCSRPVRSTTSFRRWAEPACPRARSAVCARRSTRGPRPFLDRSLECDWPHVRLDATYGKVRRKVVDQLRPKLPKLANFMDEAEDDLLAYMSFPADHWLKIHSTNGLERLNGEVKRRTEVVGTFPNDDAIVRLVGAILPEQNDEWAVQRARYMTLETKAALSDDPIVGSPAMVI